ncbi:MAG TPA: hypothetical protein VL119_03925 [Acidimicrobiia bacterium]|nr:hypothetical protein [Acidimicrobiia bacterium]
MRMLFLPGLALSAWVASIGLTYSKVDGIGTRVLVFLTGAGLFALLARGLVRSLRRPMVADQHGVSGLWVPDPRTTHAWLNRLWTRGTWLPTVTPWDQIDHAAAEFIRGSEGGVPMAYSCISATVAGPELLLPR